jgi:PASTA domain
MAVRRTMLVIKGSILVIAAAALAACGGSSDSGGGGSTQVSVPSVAGDTQAAATTAITGAGLTVGTVTTQSSSSVASGDVISENPAAGTKVAKSSAVALLVSSGPTTQTVGGILIGLGTSATVHVLNGSDNVSIAANGSFTLPTAVPSGGKYSVTVGTPSSAQTCAVQNGSGTIASANVTNVVVYCTFNVSNATLNKAYTEVLAGFDVPATGGGPAGILDAVGTITYDGAGNWSLTATLNYGGSIFPGSPFTGTYAVTTTNAIPSLAGGGGIEGVNGDSDVGANMASGTPPSIDVDVLPDTAATTTSINGNYTLVDLTAQLSTGNIYGYEATITLTNGTISGTYTQNNGGTITTGNPATGQWSVTNGVITSVGSASGAVSADGDLIVLADTNSGDDPYINVAVLRGSGVTPATVEGVYSVVEYGGTPVTSTFGEVITLFAYGNGTFSVTLTKNANGTVMAPTTGTGTYTVAADGTLTITDAEGDVYSGAISADGNALVLASVASQQNPAIFVGLRQ